ncbi:MAG: hypothetical protein V4511_13140 [Bacteroidota bacterium]
MKKLIILFLLLPSLLFSQVSPSKIVRIADASTVFGSALSYGTYLEMQSNNKTYKIINVNGVAGSAMFSGLVLNTDYIEEGTVTSVSTAAANNGVTATWSMASPTPALTIGLGAITPTSVNALSLTALATGFTVAGGTTSKTLTVPLDASVSGTNTGDQTITLTGDVTGSGTGSFSTTIAGNAVTDAKFRQGVARSIVGVTGNATANTADMQGTTDQILRVNGAGTALAFGSIDLSKSAAVGTSVLPVANGGTNSATQNWVDLTTAQNPIAGAKTWTGLGTFSLGITTTGSAVNLNASSNFGTNINTGTSSGTVTIGGSVAQTISIGDGIGGNTVSMANGVNSAAQTISIGSGANAANNTINIGSGTNTAGVIAVTVGSNAAFANTTAIKGGNGVGAITLDPHVAGTIVIGDAAGTGDITIGSSTAAQTVLIGNGVNASAQTVSIANGATAADATVNILSGVGTAGTAILNLADNPRVTTIDIGNIAPTVARTITIAGGNSAVADVVNLGTGLVGGAGSKTINIATGASAAGTNTVNIGTGATTVNGGNEIHIGDGTPTGSGTNEITIGSSITTAGNGVRMQGVQSQVYSNGVVTLSSTVTITAAQMLKSGIIYHSQADNNARTFTFDTGANIAAAMPGGSATVGDTFSFIVANGRNTVTLAAGASGSFFTGAVLTVAVGVTKVVTVTFTGATTYVCY